MSTNNTPEPDKGHLDAWITRQLNDLADQVGEQLDLDAGLRDAQLVDRARLLDESLDEVLDVESGLLAILGRDVQPQQEPVIPDSNESTVSATSSLTRYARTFASLPVDERLRLRSHLSFRTLVLIHSLVVLPAHHQNVVDVLGSALVRDLTLVRGLTLARDLNHVLISDLTLARDLAHDLAHAHVHDLTHVLTLAHDLNHVRDLAHDLDLTLVRDLDLALDLARDLDFTLARVLDRDRVLALLLDYNPGSARDLSSALRADIIRFSTNGEFAALASAIESVEAAASDFTTADLTHQDLLEVDLRGVRWSALTTHWPPGWEEPMREVSVQIDPDGRPDLYEVRDEPRVRRDAHKP